MFVFIANIATNILYMALPVFTTQVYGRVLQSQSQETLFVLGVCTLFAFLIMTILGPVLIAGGILRGGGRWTAAGAVEPESCRRVFAREGLAPQFALPWFQWD